MFYDLVKIKIKAGDGGNGLVSFRRERYIARGGPDGGDGGHGGSIFFKVNANLGTLHHFRTVKNFKANSGASGGKKKMKGRSGKDLVLEVPPGTLVYDNKTNELLYDLSEKKEEIEIAEGGRGGFGNTHFATSKNQAPRMFELGEPGEEKYLRLELKLIADVAIIGIPSVGKSTLISVISNARPKIAKYPFTTLVPNLGMVEVDDFSFVAIDVPGLIKDSHKGKGLGDAFLRHIERSRIIVHLLDVTSRDILADYMNIRKELKLYSPKLIKKPEIIAINKIDVVEDKQLEAENLQLTKKLKKITKNPIYFISAVTKKGTRELLYEVVKQLSVLPRPAFVKEKKKVFRPQEKLLRNIEILKEKDTFIVKGKRLERIASQTDPGNIEALSRLYKAIKTAGLKEMLKVRSVKDSHLIKIGRRQARLRDDKIIIIG